MLLEVIGPVAIPDNAVMCSGNYFITSNGIIRMELKVINLIYLQENN